MIVVNTCWVYAGISKGGLFNRCKNVTKNVNDSVRGFVKIYTCLCYNEYLGRWGKQLMPSLCVFMHYSGGNY